VRILFDQGVPVPRRRHLADHSVETAAELRWAALSDRQLLGRAEADRFDLLITTDRNLKHQQVLTGRRLAILVLSTTSWPRIRRRATDVAQAVDALSAGDYQDLQIQ